VNRRLEALHSHTASVWIFDFLREKIPGKISWFLFLHQKNSRRKSQKNEKEQTRFFFEETKDPVFSQSMLEAFGLFMVCITY
jgi:hypothetical protein